VFFSIDKLCGRFFDFPPIDFHELGDDSMKLKYLAVCLVFLFCASSLVNFAWSKNYAILIGINEYQEFNRTEGYDRVFLKKLKYCVADMKDLKKALHTCKFADDETTIVLLATPKETTSEYIRSVLEKYQKELGEGDTILVAFAGHGISLAPKNSPNEKGDYFCCSNAQIKYNLVSEKFENKGLISLTEMDKILEDFKCSSKVFFTDACRNIFEDESSENIIEDESSENINTRSSGQRSESSVRSGTVVAGNSIRGLIKKTNMTNAPNNSIGFFRIASCSSGEVSHESEKLGLGHGVFTYYLIKGLNGAAAKGEDREITLHDLFTYASKQTSETVPTLPDVPKGSTQTPTITGNMKEATKASFTIGFFDKPNPDGADGRGGGGGSRSFQQRRSSGSGLRGT